jgi:Fe-S-cluster-containing dehydrogenase component
MMVEHIREGVFMAEPLQAPDASGPLKWAKVIDHQSCVGCHACTTACKSENEVPLSVTRTYVKYADVGVFPQARRAFQVTRCNQCEDPPCANACPTRAMHQRPDGIVDFDKSICIGCKACIAACPYDAIFINPEDHSAEKCNFCAHRIDVGLEPACVVVCPTEAIMVGDMNDPGSRVAQMAHRQAVTVRRPEKATRPKLFYRGAHQATLDPLAAQRPEGGIFMWSQQLEGAHYVVSGNPEVGNTSAEAILAYDIPHRTPWDWRVSLYTLTKGIAAGVYLMALLFMSVEAFETTGVMWKWVTPLLGFVFLGITGALLIWDLEHPTRFYMIFTKSHWKSWLVKGSYIIAGYSMVLAIHFLGSLFAQPSWQIWVAWPFGLILAVLTSVYTAYLFAQARARDLWQSPLLPPHMLLQTLMAGTAILAPCAAIYDAAVVLPLLRFLGVFSLIHLLLILGEMTLTHSTEHARLAAHEMTRGRYKIAFWTGVILAAIAVAAPWLGPWIAAPVALLAILAFEHAYVQAGQAVPLA